jgi:hypothetical protein
MVVAQGAVASFAFDSELNFASVARLAPFSATGEFSRLADAGGRWSGPLTVDFPGLKAVPLATRNFAAELTRNGRAALLEPLSG